jgi:hypothetical protein
VVNSEDNRKISGGNGGGGVLTVMKPGQRFGGRAKGTPNRVNTILKDAILLAAGRIGYSQIVRNEQGEIVKLIRTGKDGLDGYLDHICETDTKLFVSLLARVLPMQVNMRVDAQVKSFRSTDAILEDMRKEGLHEELLPPRLRLVEPEKDA